MEKHSSGTRPVHNLSTGLTYLATCFAKVAKRYQNCNFQGATTKSSLSCILYREPCVEWHVAHTDPPINLCNASRQPLTHNSTSCPPHSPVSQWPTQTIFSLFLSPLVNLFLSIDDTRCFFHWASP